MCLLYYFVQIYGLLFGEMICWGGFLMIYRGDKWRNGGALTSTSISIHHIMLFVSAFCVYSYLQQLRREKSSLQVVTFFEPECGAGIGWHAPVAAWREGDTAHLGTIGEARALELLVEEAPEEYA